MKIFLPVSASVTILIWLIGLCGKFPPFIPFFLVFLLCCAGFTLSKAIHIILERP